MSLGKSHGPQQPSALGTLINASTYGMTIPTIYGMARGAFLPIWAANLREGDSGKKGKGFLGHLFGLHVPTYVENVDYLIGSNPIEYIGQIWSNNTNRYTMNIIKVRFQLPAPTHTIVDSHFYAVIGVTAEVTLSGTFNDYGSPGYNGNAIGQYAGIAPGTGYAINDEIILIGGTISAYGHITSIGGGGTVTGFVLDYLGQGYVPGNYSTTSSGSGHGLIVHVTSVGGSPYSGTTEFPLWNCVQHGPDLIYAASSRWWPYVYKWAPSDGNVIHFPEWQNVSNRNIPNGNTFFNAYYFQMTKLSKYHPPLTYNRMAFEQELGSGTEYANAGLAGQQIIYPYYAGAGSSDIDLGVTGLLPDWRIEIKGSNALYPTGDADFADMIEDVLKSGQMQTLSELGLIQRGVNCNEIPGVTQKEIWQGLEFFMLPDYNYFQPIAQNTIMIVGSRARPGATPATISDASGQTWNAIATGDTYGVWYAVANAPIAAPDLISVRYAGGGQYNNDAFAFTMDPGSDTLLGTAQNSGAFGAVPQTASCSITTNVAAYVMAFFFQIGPSLSGTPSGVPPPPVHWNDMYVNPNAGVPAILYSWSRVYYRNVAAAGTYELSLPGIEQDWTIVMLAISASQPSPWPKTLGNIIDQPSLQLLRNQCRANGLIGSIVMNSQKAASDWLKEFYDCANSWPVWSGFKLKSVPRSEVSTMGNGVVYTAPTAAGPAATLTEDDLIMQDNALVITERAPQVDRNNILQFEFVDRTNDYNVSTASEPESASIALYGPRKQNATVRHEIMDPLVARELLAIEVRRLTMITPFSYKFVAKANWVPLEAGDMVLINDSLIGITDLAVRITAVEETDSYDLNITAEPFIYGVHAPSVNLSATVISQNPNNSQYVPAAVNPPVIFEPPTRLSSTGNPQLWFVVSDSDPLYGGCVIYVSIDGGTTYETTPVGIILGNGTTGYVEIADWPAAADPDAVNTLYLDVSESLGVLNSYSVDQRDSFAYPNYVALTPSPTPVFDGASVGGAVSPATSIAFGAGFAGDAAFVFGHIRSTAGAIWWNSGINTTPNVLSGLNTCQIIDCFGPVQFGAPCSGCLPPGGDTAGWLEISGVNSPGWNFNFGGVQTGFTAPGGARLIDFTSRLLAAGTASGSITLDEFTFNYTGANIIYGGGEIFMARLGGLIPGNPTLYVVAIIGTAVDLAAPAGWTKQVAGGTSSIPIYTRTGVLPEPSNFYELMTYETANLTASYHYSIPPTTRRAVFGMPTAGEGEDHNIGSRYAWLNAWENPTPDGILKIDFDNSWLNKQLFFKFTQFNNLGGNPEDLSAVVAYNYTPIAPQSGGGSTGGGTGQPGTPGQITYTIQDAALSNPNVNAIVMDSGSALFSDGSAAAYAARTFTIPTPTVATTYYITIFDPNRTGDGGPTPTLTAQAETNNQFVGVPGYIYIGSIVALPGSGGGTSTSPGGYPVQEQILVNGT
jgi:hypothetical protein